MVGHDGKAVPVAGKFTTVNPDTQVNGQFQLAYGQVVGEGWNNDFGGPHAEVVTLAAAGEKAARIGRPPDARWGALARGSMVSTSEPISNVVISSQHDVSCWMCCSVSSTGARCDPVCWW